MHFLAWFAVVALAGGQLALIAAFAAWAAKFSHNLSAEVLVLVYSIAWVCHALWALKALWNRLPNGN